MQTLVQPRGERVDAPRAEPSGFHRGGVPLGHTVVEPPARRSVAQVDLSVILPVFNEAECIESTIREVFECVQPLGLGFEILAIDDGSTDATSTVLRSLRATVPCLRVCRLQTNSGQSLAMGTGFARSRGGIVVIMDADGQNDPRDIGRLLEHLGESDACCGYRRERKDTWSKRVGSRMANAVRRRVLGDTAIDTGCSLKAIRAPLARALPMHLHGMHRFIPALLLMQGARIAQIPVNHRPRTAGQSKYTNLGRLKRTIRDLMAVRWMRSRARFSAVVEEVSKAS